MKEECRIAYLPFASTFVAKLASSHDKLPPPSGGKILLNSPCFTTIKYVPQLVLPRLEVLLNTVIPCSKVTQMASLSINVWIYVSLFMHLVVPVLFVLPPVRVNICRAAGDTQSSYQPRLSGEALACPNVLVCSPLDSAYTCRLLRSFDPGNSSHVADLYSPLWFARFGMVDSLNCV
jgi:hypothetical protein